MNFYISQFVVLFLIFVRVMTMIGIAPLLSQPGIPNATKIGLGILVSYILFTAHRASPFADVGASLNLGTLLIYVLKEVIVGISIGYAIMIVMAGVQFAGYLIATDMGLSMANIFNPELNEQVPVRAELMYIICMLLFMI